MTPAFGFKAKRRSHQPNRQFWRTPSPEIIINNIPQKKGNCQQQKRQTDLACRRKSFKYWVLIPIYIQTSNKF
jgi:hypothetical protein